MNDLNSIFALEILVNLPDRSLTFEFKLFAFDFILKDVESISIIEWL